MPTAATIILNYVCPILGIVFTNWQNVAPLKDLDTAVKNGQGLNGLNPTPWIFMLGTTLAWTAYALLSNDYYLLLADCPGFMASIWLNLGAIKLMYSDHHQNHTKKGIVRLLQKNDKEIEEMRKTLELRRTMVQFQVDLPIEEEDLEKNEEEEEYAPKEDKTNSENGEEDSEEHNGSAAPMRMSDRSNDQKKPVRFSSLASFQWKSMANFATSFAKRKEKVNNWADVVWKITAQQSPAGAAHEKLLIGMIGLWTLIFCVLMLYSFHDRREDRYLIPLQVVGYFAVGVQLFFYGAPLARIGHVLKTKKCDCIHMQSLIGNFLNCLLWTGYGLAPQVMDPFIWAPCALGCIFCAIQFFLCAIFPRSSAAEKEAKRFSITSMLEPSTEFFVSRGKRFSLTSMLEPSTEFSSTLTGGPDISETVRDISEDKSEEMDLADLERNQNTEEEQENTNGFGESQYMTSFGHYSYLF